MELGNGAFLHPSFSTISRKDYVGSLEMVKGSAWEDKTITNRRFTDDMSFLLRKNRS